MLVAFSSFASLKLRYSRTLFLPDQPDFVNLNSLQMNIFRCNFWEDIFWHTPWIIYLPNPLEISDIDWISSRRALADVCSITRCICVFNWIGYYEHHSGSLLAACGKERRSLGLHVIQVNIRGIRTSLPPVLSFVYILPSRLSPLYPTLRRSSPYLVSSKSFNEKDLGFTRH